MTKYHVEFDTESEQEWVEGYFRKGEKSLGGALGQQGSGYRHIVPADATITSITPPAQVGDRLTTEAELSALPHFAVVMHESGNDVFQKLDSLDEHRWHCAATGNTYGTPPPAFVTGQYLTVVWLPPGTVVTEVLGAPKVGDVITENAAERIALLPTGSVVLDTDGDAWQRIESGWGVVNRTGRRPIGFDVAVPAGYIPLTVIHVGD